MQIPFQEVYSSCYLLLTKSSEHKAIRIMECDILWTGRTTKISANQIITKGWRIKYPYGRIVKVYCWFCQLKAIAFGGLY